MLMYVMLLQIEYQSQMKDHMLQIFIPGYLRWYKGNLYRYAYIYREYVIYHVMYIKSCCRLHYYITSRDILYHSVANYKAHSVDHQIDISAWLLFYYTFFLPSRGWQSGLLRLLSLRNIAWSGGYGNPNVTWSTAIAVFIDACGGLMDVLNRNPWMRTIINFLQPFETN